jgi:hypothetical protein
MAGVVDSPADEDGNFNAGECSESHAWFQPAGTPSGTRPACRRHGNAGDEPLSPSLAPPHSY